MSHAVTAPGAHSSDSARSVGATWVCLDARSAPTAERARTLAAEGFTSADVTLYGPSAEVHGFHTREPGSFAAQVRGAQALVRAGLEVGFTVPVTRANVRHLTELVDVAASLGARAIRFAPSGDAPNSSIAVDHVDAALRRAARLRLRAVPHAPTADDAIFGHSANAEPSQPAHPVFRSPASPPVTPLPQSAR